MLALTDSEALWYLTRGTGLVSLVLLTIVMALGVAEVQRFAAPGWPRFVVAGLHKNASLLVVVFLGVHIATAVLDGFAPIEWISAVVPFTSAYRPLWLGLGTLAFDLLIALVITSLVRQRLGPRTWRVVHWAAYACWPLALVHGLGTGSDGRNGWVQITYLVSIGVVVAALGWRLAGGWQTNPRRRVAGALASVLLLTAVFAWAAEGPTRAGWARKAGTPGDLLGSPTGVADAVTDTGGATAAPVAPFTASLTGSIKQSGGATTGAAATVTIDGTLSGGTEGVLQIVISGRTSSSGGVVMQQSEVSLGSTDQPDVYQGTVQRLSGTELTAVVQDAAGNAMTLDVTLHIDDRDDAVTGTVTAQPGSSVSAGDDEDH